jgi:HEPN domain-containing protein
MRLSRHYIATRYPDAHAAGAPGAHYGREDSLEALADMQAIQQSIDELWAKLVREESLQSEGNESGETEGEHSGGGG